MTSPRRRTRASGFTLVEVLVSMTVLVMVFMSALAGLSIGFKMLEEARATTLASQILQSEVENLRLRNWTQIEAIAADSSMRKFTPALDTGLKGFPRFECTRDFHRVTGHESVLKQAVLTVAWTATDGRTRSRRYVTYIAKDGLNDYSYRAF